MVTVGERKAQHALSPPPPPHKRYFPVETGAGPSWCGGLSLSMYPVARGASRRGGRCGAGWGEGERVKVCRLREEARRALVSRGAGGEAGPGRGGGGGGGGGEGEVGDNLEKESFLK